MRGSGEVGGWGEYGMANVASMVIGSIVRVVWVVANRGEGGLTICVS